PGDRGGDPALASPTAGDSGACDGRGSQVTPVRERLARTPPGYRFSIGRVLAIYAGLMVTLLLAALDQTIVATALPKVVSDLGGLSSYSWVFTAYMLASTVTVPLYGKLGDHTTWRWIFSLHLPVGGLALVVIYVTMPRRAEKRPHSVDWSGGGILALGSCALLLGLVWGGQEHPWASAEVLGALAVAAAL